MKSVLFPIRSKGLLKYLKRGQTIMKSYGLTSSKMVQALDRFSQILQEFQCGATFPTTAVSLERSGQSIEKYVVQGIEFALHGYRHIDHSQLPLEGQVAHLRRAQDVFAAAGIPAVGFRSPYLRFNENLRAALKEVGLKYVSSQPILWDVLDGESFSPAAQTAYERAVAFYTPWHAAEQPSLPHLHDQLVEIPVSLPDDEMLLDRLGGGVNGLVERAWSRMLAETHRCEELFTIQLHPERIVRCASALSTLLAKARALDPPVWVARLEEIATWWRARSEATVTVTNADSGRLRLSLDGPEGTVILVRNVEVEGPTHPWIHGYRRCGTPILILKTRIRPFIGVPVDTPPEPVSFLRQQGYIVEASDNSQSYSVYLEQLGSVSKNKRALLARIEENNKPLIKLGRWPNNTCSTLAITGDIDALTLWDYGLRYLGY
jgi:peptidoglycan/xylan/chitin deacetylase (PgdA/CDA1 family)